jgi:sec-independent protein translocase protein TatA
MFGLGVGEIVIILVVALIFIGPKKLPELARGLGKGMREFQNAARGIQETIKNPTPDQPEQNNTPPAQVAEGQARTAEGHTEDESQYLEQGYTHEEEETIVADDGDVNPSHSKKS